MEVSLSGGGAVSCYPMYLEKGRVHKRFLEFTDSVLDQSFLQIITQSAVRLLQIYVAPESPSVSVLKMMSYLCFQHSVVYYKRTGSDICNV